MSVTLTLNAEIIAAIVGALVGGYVVLHHLRASEKLHGLSAAGLFIRFIFAISMGYNSPSLAHAFVHSLAVFMLLTPNNLPRYLYYPLIRLLVDNDKDKKLTNSDKDQ